MLDPNTDALKTLARLHKQVNNGEEVTITPITATTDARFYALYVSRVCCWVQLMCAGTMAFRPPATAQSRH